ncbi:hypothetical protein DV451_000383 [Geotrichum candidum]|uniref:Phosphatidyl-N-methylethanolamine N-methyltransferase n=1 Tax=Geotrichum candidum TaxID=1173061 RepID=A0A9P5GBN7_GEOCN|nr:hypothetical protein DV451_000383 [Geotrichum candidum]KAF5111483.1 hypothetical protein DV453_000128 [Geotrichum candidum]
MCKVYQQLAKDCLAHIDFDQTSLWKYHSKLLTKLAFGNSRLGCYGLALTIFSLGIVRDILYEKALRDQPAWSFFTENSDIVKALAIASFSVGNVLVLSSMWALGVTGTYLGDYFGILMDDIVTGFPFNVTNNPMYYGSTLSFLGTALWFGKPAGIFVTVFVLVMYLIALRFEEPFTAEIYAKRERERAQKTK